MALTNIGLCNRALLKIGIEPIHDFDSKNPQTIVANMLYGSSCAALLSSYPWGFATAKEKLHRIDEGTNTKYKFQYRLPESLLTVLSANKLEDYKVSGTSLYADAEEVRLTYIFRPQEMNWPPYFDQAAISRLASEFSLPLTESLSRTAALRRIADKDFATARLIDAHH